MRDILVLGGSGFVGKHLLSILGHEAEAPSSSSLSLTEPNSADKLAQTISSKTKIVMLAALTPDRGKDLSAMEKNILMATSLCKALEKSPARQVVLVSSDAVYPDSESFITESTRTDTGNLYGLGHSVREKIISEAAARLGISLLILRPSAIYGFGDTHNSYGPNRFIKTAKEKGEIALFGDGSDKRDHLFVSDLTAAISQGLKNEMTGIYNITSGTSLSFKEVAEYVAKAFKTTFKADIKISTSAPKPPTFRHFDPTKRLQGFPQLKATSIEEGINQVVVQLFKC
jgi:UDP-glucose 4-epimerase